MKRRPFVSKRERARARKSFIRVNENQIECVDNAFGLKEGRTILLRKMRSGTSNRALIRCIANSKHQAELFAFLVAKRKERGQWKQLVDAILKLPDGFWESEGGQLNEEMVAEHLQNPLALQRIASSRYKRSVVATEQHPLFGKLSFDSYWSHRVNYCTSCCDFERAWSELRHAYRGFRIEGRLVDESAESERAFWADPENRCYAASKIMVRNLINELFDTMVEEGVIQDLKRNDRRAPRDRKIKWAYRRVNGKSQRYSYEVDAKLPAWDIVCTLGGVREKWNESCSRKERMFATVPAARAYKLGKYFRNLNRSKKELAPESSRVATSA